MTMIYNIMLILQMGHGIVAIVCVKTRKLIERGIMLWSFYERAKGAL